ncbi:alpha/beta fold hydrolase [Rubrivivax sp. A210]|uniref:alpha/beta fold hydrolase n=1 Tax=Rubrivivax sp. A210 TaxID=2772301 RepID=UPI00191A366C|nr:alpha/beta fold hydrolase [Rubrivivax sp. A210]
MAARFSEEIEPLWSQQVQRGEFTGLAGVKLAYAAALVPDARAAVVIVTGRTENLLKYQEVVADLVRLKYSVYVYDHRGQGFSGRLLPDEPQKGHVVQFDDYVEDLQAFIQQVVGQKPHRKLLLLAHSMGGGVASRHLQKYPGVFAAAALSSPMHEPNAKILISTDSSCWYFRATGWFRSETWAGWLPKPYAHGPYDEKSNDYTHSPARWAQVLRVEMRYPEVRLGGPTRGWAAEACAASSTLLSNTAQIVTPVLVLQAGEDTAVMPEGQNEFCAALSRNTGRACDGGGPQKIEGARHELLIEADRYRVPAMAKILDFFDRSQAR